MTWTLNRKVFAAAAILLFLVSFSAASHDSGIEGLPEGYEVPDFESQEEMIMELIVPFIGISVLLQFALHKTLLLTLASEKSNPFSGKNAQRSKARRQSIVLSLVLTGMLVPSPYWDWIITGFQGITLAAMIGLFVGVMIVMYFMLGLNQGGGNGE